MKANRTFEQLIMSVTKMTPTQTARSQEYLALLAQEQELTQKLEATQDALTEVRRLIAAIWTRSFTE